MPRSLPSYRQTFNLVQQSSQPAPPLPSIWHSLPTLPGAGLATFKRHAFTPSNPFLFPAGTFSSVPAIEKWFQISQDTQCSTVNMSYLQPYGDTMLPVEYTHPTPDGGMNFQRGSVPLALFLSWIQHATSSTRAVNNITQKLYVAQASLSLLPTPLHNDLAVPEYVQKAGKGDIYDSSLWMGLAPTYTPLHRDPNPNLFVQLVGSKRVRILTPEQGERLFGVVREEVNGEDGGGGSKAFRGEEMMAGKERRVLEEKVWGESRVEGVDKGWEAEVRDGDGMFIPTGFWHSVKGIGAGLTASVNWWFR